MFSQLHPPVVRLIVSLVLTFALIYGPVPMTPVRAGSPATSGAVGAVQPVADKYRSSELPVDFREGSTGSGIGSAQSGEVDLDYMRNNRPNRAEERLATNFMLPPDYDDPEPTGNYGDYYTVAGRIENDTGRAGSRIGRVGDPTIAGSVTGNQSIILGSQNVNFSVPILSLGGRGKGIDLALSYNSRGVWLRNPWSDGLAFNIDGAFPGPGWSIGFGKILGDHTINSTSILPFWNRDLGKYTYILVEPDGTRRILIGSTSPTENIYRTDDSSRIEYHRDSRLLYRGDGTNVHFTFPTNAQGYQVGSMMLPDEIKDRNGNTIQITNAHLPNGKYVIDYITDSMGRVIDFYYENNFLTEVRQERSGERRVFVKLAYAPVLMQTDFNNVPSYRKNYMSGQTIWEPWYIEFPNQMNYRIFYTSYGQAYQFEKWVPAIDGQGGERMASYTWYDLPSINGQSAPAGATRPPNNSPVPQNGCPTFAFRDEWAENWNGNNVAHTSYYFFSDASGTHTRITDPVGRIYRTDVSGDGLTQIDRVWANSTSYGSDSSPGTPLKTVTSIYEKAPDGLRIKESIITDGTYTKRTAILYWTQVWVSLPADIIEYENGGSNVYRHTIIYYNLDTAYTDRHIFGVVGQEALFRGAGTGDIVSSKAYFYDEPDYFDTGDFSVVQHDSANYGTGFVKGRANRTTVIQYDPQAATWRDISHTKYNKTGMVTVVTDAAGNTTQFLYDDNFSVPASPPASRGLVTRVKDPDGNWSGAKYNWYSGLPVETYHIAGTDGNGAHENVVTRAYDWIDRITEVNRPAGHGGQTSYAYWDRLLTVAVYTKIDATKTYFSSTAYDGAGRVRFVSGDHPDGATGKYWIQRARYDAVGREIASSNPTASDGNGNPIDDDAALGWLYTTTSYDALDRPLTVTRPDGNKIQYSYSGCGCAGNSTVTVTDERGRKSKTVYDFLGRLKEAHNLTSAGATYSKAVYTYDVRDLLMKIAHYNSGSAHQDRTFVYDTYGRLQSQTTPEAGTISYGYKPNDWIDYVENNRIVSGSTRYRATFGHNGRGQITEVKYNDNNATPDVYYEYGEYGERTWMSEKNDAGATLGSTQYIYDPYKRLESEVRTFQGLGGTFRVSYAYNNADALKRITYGVNTWEKNVSYDYTQGGALMKVGSDLASGAVTENVAKDFSYRGFHGLKNVTYGNGRKLTLGYDQSRLQMTSLQLTRADGSDPIVNLSYDYYTGGGGSAGNNGRIRRITDRLDSTFSADFGYDDHNRLTSYAGNYQRSYTYDPWGNLTGVSSSTGGGEAPNYTLSYAANANGAPLNNRINSPGYSYDAAGNTLSDGGQTLTYDAANRLKTASGGNSIYEYDGDGNRIRQASDTETIYYLWSSVLGQPVVEIAANATPQVYRAYVYSPSGQMMAMQSHNGSFYWSHSDHLGSGRKLTDVSGAVVYSGEFDPHGQALYEWSSGALTNLNSRKFTGYERDAATNLDNAKARTYHHNRGRFMQPDPLGLAASDLTDPQSLNLYSYVQNDPANATDPSGLMAWRGWEGEIRGGGSGITIRIETWEAGPAWWNELPGYESGFWRQSPGARIRTNPRIEGNRGGGGGGSRQGDGKKESGREDEKAIINSLGVCGVAASIGEYSNEIDDSWKGINGKWYSKSWGGNQYTGARSGALGRAAGYQLLGKAMFGVSTGISIVQGVQAYEQKDYAGVAKSGLDIGMGVVGTFGGPIGATAAGVYFAVDVFIGWDEVARFAHKQFENSRLTPGSRCWN